MTTQEQTLGDLVTAIPTAARVFHRYQLDYCCGGRQTLADACAPRGIDALAVLGEIQAANQQAPAPARWDERPLSELIRHILDRYHAPLKTELPRLLELARKVERVHADKTGCPTGLAALLDEIQTEVASHLAKEEQLLFPLILAGNGPTAHMPVRVMLREHEDHGQNLRRVRELTHDFALPAYACATFRELYRALAELEVELMQHIHLENNVLFPRALAG
jgi:regulator of cell morphogenesis and NO signaling